MDARVGRHVDDSAARGLEERQSGLRHVEDALDIAGEDIVEFLFPEVFKRPFPIDARRIDEHI